MFKSFKYLNYLFNVNSTKLTTSSVAQIKSVVLKANTGASRHYFCQHDSSILKNIQKITYEIKLHLPNNDVLESNMRGVLPVQGLSSTAKEIQILPSLKNTLLLSIGQLCNDNCITIFTHTDMLILKQGHVILRGKRNFFAVLQVWFVDNDIKWLK